ncbi:MAG: hypothetical protein ACKVU2_15350 [Saprospiraceae bacterium]
MEDLLLRQQTSCKHLKIKKRTTARLGLARQCQRSTIKQSIHP